MTQHITYIIPGLSVGGTERQLVQHLQYLAKNDLYTVEVITLHTPTSGGSVRSNIPTSVTVTEYNFSGGLSFKNLKVLYRHFSKKKPDIVVSSALLPNTYSRILKFFFRYKTIAREHNVYPERTLAHRIANFILYKVATDAYLAVSDESAFAAEQSAWLTAGSVIVVENGIDQNQWEKRKKDLPTKQSIKEALGFQQETKIILTVARLTPKKRINLLLEAFAIYEKIHPDYVLIVVGYGQEEGRLKKQLSELSCQDKVYFVGRYDDVERFYSIADIYALTSSQEGFPNVLLEALFFELPIVTTDAPGVSHVVTNEKIGYVVGADPESIATGFSRVDTRSEEEKISARAAARNHLPLFYVSEIVKKYEKLFTTLQ